MSDEQWKARPVRKALLVRPPLSRRARMAGASHLIRPWLPGGYSRIFRIVCVWPMGLLDYGSATLNCKIWSLPFLGLRPHALHPGAIQGKEGIKFCHLATMDSTKGKEGRKERTERRTRTMTAIQFFGRIPTRSTTLKLTGRPPRWPCPSNRRAPPRRTSPSQRWPCLRRWNFKFVATMQTPDIMS